MILLSNASFGADRVFYFHAALSDHSEVAKKPPRMEWFRMKDWRPDPLALQMIGIGSATSGNQKSGETERSQFCDRLTMQEDSFGVWCGVGKRGRARLFWWKILLLVMVAFNAELLFFILFIFSFSFWKVCTIFNKIDSWRHHLKFSAHLFLMGIGSGEINGDVSCGFRKTSKAKPKESYEQFKDHVPTRYSMNQIELKRLDNLDQDKRCCPCML